jgi:hypothetical protein
MPVTLTSRRRLRSATTPLCRGERRRGRTAALAFVAALGALYPLLRRPILTWGATSDVDFFPRSTQPDRSRVACTFTCGLKARSTATKRTGSKFASAAPLTQPRS